MHVSSFSGRGASVKGLCEAYLSGAPVHAALLLGPEGVGKRTLASTLAQSLFCTGEGPKPCGVCPGCRRYLAGSHPDAYRIETKKRISVDEIRELITSLSSAAYEGGFRTVIIESAGAMTTQAQNSLLKTLEEPPPGTAFLLTAVSASQLLPTIRSRCAVVQVPPFSQAEVETLLTDRGIAPERAAELSAMSGGSLGRAIEMDGDAAFWQLRDKVYTAMDSIRRPSDVLQAVNTLKDDREHSARIADLLENALRDALTTALTGGHITSGGWPQTLSHLNPRTLVTLLENTAQMRRMLGSNVPWQAALERFLLEYTEETKTWQS